MEKLFISLFSMMETLKAAAYQKMQSVLRFNTLAMIASYASTRIRIFFTTHMAYDTLILKP